MSDETQFKNARWKMDLNKKRDELNTYIADYGHAEVFNRGFDAAVEILSAEKVSCARHESHNRECLECVKYAYYETKEKVFNLETERNEAEYKVKELEKALNNCLIAIDCVGAGYLTSEYSANFDVAYYDGKKLLSKLRGLK